MASYTVALKSQRAVARQTRAFYLERPGEFEFVAGQHMTVRLPQIGGSSTEERSRTFTIASAPHERDLVVATRLRDSWFKKNLEQLGSGAEISVTGPAGDFTWISRPRRQSVFLAGGIGITPFRSFLSDMVHRGTDQAVALFYSNRRPADAAFLDELTAWEKQAQNFRLLLTMTAPELEDRWDGRTGRLSQTMLEDAVADVQLAEYYIAGPPEFVDAMRDMLAEAQVPVRQIHYEEFFGY